MALHQNSLNKKNTKAFLKLTVPILVWVTIDFSLKFVELNDLTIFIYYFNFFILFNFSNLYLNFVFNFFELKTTVLKRLLSIVIDMLIIYRIFIGFDFSKSRYWYSDNINLETISYMLFLLPVLYALYSINKYKKYSNPIKKRNAETLSIVIICTFITGAITQIILPLFFPEWVVIQLFNVAIIAFVIVFYLIFIRSVYNQSNLFNLVFETTPLAIYFTDKDLLIIGGNNHFLNLIKEKSIENVIGSRFNKYMNIIEYNELVTIDLDILKTGNSFNKIIKESADGHNLYEINKNPIYENNKIIGILTTMKNITNQLLLEDKLKNLSFRDSLTGLYNRTYYNENIAKFNKKINLPLSIVMIDVNGLKLMNDVFTHKSGDLMLIKIAHIINDNIEYSSTCCRLGGDEFVILMPLTTRKNAKRIMNDIQNEISETVINGIHLSISYGVATKKASTDSINEILTRADVNMYNQKNTNNESVRLSQIDQIMDLMKDNLPEEFAHSVLVSKYLEHFATKLDHSNSEIKDFKQIGLYHDIGKIAVNYNLANNKETQINDEAYSLKRHTELGYIIMKSCNKFQGYAESIYYHHENYDGTGYPRGLKEKNIPYNARFLSIVENICDRISTQDTKQNNLISYLKDNSGKKFDPELSELIINEIIVNGLPK